MARCQPEETPADRFIHDPVTLAEPCAHVTFMCPTLSASSPVNHPLWSTELIENSAVFLYISEEAQQLRWQPHTRTHKVPRNVELILTRHKASVFVPLFVHWNKDSLSGLDFYNTGLHSHTHHLEDRSLESAPSP